MEALLSATRYGGEIMMMGGELGSSRTVPRRPPAGGRRPLSNLPSARSRQALAVMKDGVFYQGARDPLGADPLGRSVA